MNRIFTCVLVAACFSVVFCANALAAGGSPKIGYFDIQAAIAQSETGKRALEDLKKEEEKLGGALEQKGRAFMTAKDEYDKKKDVMDEKTRTRKEKDLADMYNELQKLRSDSNAKFNDEKSAATAPLLKRVNEIANKIGKDEKYDYIFEKAVLHFTGADTNDLTRRISTELDKSPPK
jgi:outer membrane protein